MFNEPDLQCVPLVHLMKFSLQTSIVVFLSPMALVLGKRSQEGTFFIINLELSVNHV